MIERERLTTGFYHWQTKYGKRSILEITDTMSWDEDTNELSHDFVIWLLGKGDSVTYEEFIEQIEGKFLAPILPYIAGFHPFGEED